MNAVLMQGYGEVSQLKYGETSDPQPGPGEVLVKVLGTSINPVDLKIRQGAMKERMPLEFPFILGRDVAGEIVAGGGDRFRAGERVMRLVNHSYAELLTAKAEDLTSIPGGLAFEDAAALPLILLTGRNLWNSA